MRLGLLLILLAQASVLAHVACSPAPSGGPADRSANDSRSRGRPIVDARQRGVSWVAGGPVAEDDFRPLVENHVTWIAQNPFGWQKRHDSPRIVTVTDGRVLWGEADAGLETTARLARRFGIKTLLKPQIWLNESEDGKWLTSIEMRNEEEWQRWFTDYREFILHYARLAEQAGIEALCVGAELRATVGKREADWRRIIADVRAVYHGKLTYAANWYREFEEVPFWDALDFIGIQAYFPLSEKENPSLDELKRGWRPHLEAIEEVHRKFGKPVVFTEIGYRSTPDAAVRPWEWPDRSFRPATDDGLALQAGCYEALFETFWPEDWFSGAYVWKWYPGPRRTTRGPGRDFTPQGKPAESVLSRWYGAQD